MRSFPTITFLTFVASSCAFAQVEQPALDELIATVNCKNSIKSAEAITAIGKRKPASDLAIQTLIDALADDRRAEYIPDYVPITFPVKTVGTTASNALAEIGKPAVLPICAFLSKERDKTIRKLAISSLSKMASAAQESLPTLQRLLNDSDLETRFEVVAAIVSIQKDARALSSTLGPVLSDRSPDVRAAAIRALGNLGENGSAHVANLVKLLDDTEDRGHSFTPDSAGTRPVRYDSAMALAEMGNEGRVALPKLRELMKGDSDTLVRIAAAYAIAKLDKVTKDALDYLIEAVQDRENGSRVPEAAAEVLGKLGPAAKATVPALVGALNHPDTMVRIHTAEAIAFISPESAESRLLPMLSDEDALVRASAIKSLGTLCRPSPKLLNSFIAALDDGDSIFGTDVRQAAAVALGKLGKNATLALPRLNRLVEEEENDWVKEAAVEAIRQIKLGR